MHSTENFIKLLAMRRPVVRMSYQIIDNDVIKCCKLEGDGQGQLRKALFIACISGCLSVQLFGQFLLSEAVESA